MISNYEAPEILEIGKAHDVIFGSIKTRPSLTKAPFRNWGEIQCKMTSKFETKHSKERRKVR